MSRTLLWPAGLMLFALVLPAGAQETQPDWVASARQAHAKFDGPRGTIAHFGDSITDTMAYWTPLLYARKNMPKEAEDAFALVSRYMRKECWRDWRGARYGSAGGMTVRWARQNIDDWLKRLDPEVALIMFGTNDLNSVPLDEHVTKLAEVVQKCLDNGTVVILSTIPPRHGFDAKARQFADAQAALAKKMQIPLIDFYSECMKRRPDDWDGALPKFAEFKGYDVPTLIARDGVHPSNPSRYKDDYSQDGLSHSGLVLRSYLSLMAYAQVIRAISGEEPSGPKALPASQPAGAKPKAGASGPPSQPWFPKAPPLPEPAGPVVKVANVDELFKAVGQARPGETIMLEDGLYMLPRSLQIRTDNVTVRGRSGDRDRVILDASRSQHTEGLSVTACSGVTIANLTLQNVKQNGYKLNSDSGVHRVTLYNCVGHNIWQRQVKGVPGQLKDGQRVPSAGCRIQYCLFYNDRPKRQDDEPYEQADPAKFGVNYIGGIDAMNVDGWTISDNVFTQIRGKGGEARGAIFIWNGSKNVTIERNVLIDCDTGICLGNSFRAEEWAKTAHCTGFVVRENFITRCPESDILAAYTKDCKITNNRVHDPDNRMGRLIRVIHDNDGLLVADNIFSGPRLAIEKYTGEIQVKDNVVKPVPEMFVDAASGNLNLAK